MDLLTLQALPTLQVHHHQGDIIQTILTSLPMNYHEKSMHLDLVEIGDLVAGLVPQDQWDLLVHLAILAHQVFLEIQDLQVLNQIYNHSLTKFKHLRVVRKDLPLILSHICKHKLVLLDLEDLQVYII